MSGSLDTGSPERQGACSRPNAVFECKPSRKAASQEAVLDCVELPLSSAGACAAVGAVGLLIVLSCRRRAQVDWLVGGLACWTVLSCLCRAQAHALLWARLDCRSWLMQAAKLVRSARRCCS